LGNFHKGNCGIKILYGGAGRGYRGGGRICPLIGLPTKEGQGSPTTNRWVRDLYHSVHVENWPFNLVNSLRSQLEKERRMKRNNQLMK